MDRQSMLNSTVALVKTAVAFALPLVVNTSATKVYSGPVMPAIRGLIPDHPVLDRRSMNVWEDDAVASAIAATGRRTVEHVFGTLNAWMGPCTSRRGPYLACEPR
jgi:hypothetical protein